LLSSPFFFPLLFIGAHAGRGLEPPPPHQLPLSLLASLTIPKLEVKDGLERVMIRNSEHIAQMLAWKSTDVSCQIENVIYKKQKK
jgi:hypothetical protein